MTEQIQVHSSSGNVFADLGLANPNELMLKAELVDRIDELISDRQLTETEAAELLGIDRSTFSALIRGKLSAFSTESLFRFLNALGSNVEIRITVNSKPNVQAGTSSIVSG